jgi:invasion protein IalB
VARLILSEALVLLFPFPLIACGAALARRVGGRTNAGGDESPMANRRSGSLAALNVFLNRPVRDDRDAHRGRCFSIPSRVRIAGIVAGLLIPVAAAAQESGGADKGTSPSPALLSEPFGDWTYRCLIAPRDGAQAQSAPSAVLAASDACEVAQTVVVRQGDRLIDAMQVALSPVKDKAGKASYLLTIKTPLSVHLAADFALETGQTAKTAAKPLILRYRNCDATGCFVLAPVDVALIGRLKQGSEAAGVFQLVNGQRVRLVFSLSGLPKALAALEARAMPKPPAQQTQAGRTAPGQAAPAQGSDQ